jgi:hypothetical protein
MNTLYVIVVVFLMGLKRGLLDKIHMQARKVIKQKTQQLIENQYIKTISNQHTFGETEVDAFLQENPFIKNKRLLSVSPAGFKGFYVMGVCKYIKQRYDLENYIFSGASAGAWNSLLLCYRNDIEEIENQVLDKQLQTSKSINEMEYLIKYRLLKNYKTDDFDLRRLFIGVSTIDHYKTNTTIFNGFDSLEDAINCCIASSHIPLITGGLTNVYRNMLTFDGGFSKYPYLNTSKPILHITPNIWKKEENKRLIDKKMEQIDYTTLFSKDKFVFSEMVEQGFVDSNQHRVELDEIFRVR